MRISRFALLAVFLVAIRPPALDAQTYIWTGQGTGWQGQVTPPATGANLIFGNSIYPIVSLSGFSGVSSISLELGNDLTFTGTTNLAIGAIGSLDTQVGILDFGSGINLAIGGSTTFNAGENTVYVRGQVTGSGPLTLTTSGGSSSTGVFVFNGASANTYTGNTTIGDATSDYVQVAFWNTAPFGTTMGTVTFANGGELISHNTNTITNPIVIDSQGLSNDFDLKSWDAPLTFSGPVTLDNNVLIFGSRALASLPAPGNSGSFLVPGEPPTNPIVFSGSVGQSGGGRSLTILGAGVIMLTGSSNTYTGGTSVGGSSNAGSLVFGDVASIPSSGLITVNQNGYLGTGDTSMGNTSFATLLSHVTTSSTGSFGIDTVPGDPMTQYTGPINLSGLGLPSSVEIGSATSAEISGTITSQTPGTYKFGGGGGTLYVDSVIQNMGASTVSNVDPGSSLPLTVYLRGANIYTGTTTANDGFIIFDGPTALPYTNPNLFIEPGGPGNVGGSYIGYTELETNITSPATFLGVFNKGSTYGIIGFDSSVPATPVTISGPIDLTGFYNGVFLGTATNAILTGSLTPSTVANGTQATNTLRFTAAQAGILTVDSTISGGVGVVLGSPNFPQFSSGTVIMNAANTYTGGTTFNGGGYGMTVGIGTNSALGNGPVSISPGGIIGIEATAASINLANSFSFLDPSPPGSAELFLKGTNSFTMSGPISGDSSSEIALINPAPLTVTLSGNNSGFLGTYFIENGTLKLPTNNSLGAGNLNFEGNGTLDLTGAMAPVIKNISDGEGSGNLGNIILSSGSTLTIDTTNDPTDSSPTFGGVISGSGAHLVVTDSNGSSNAVVLLYGANTYDGGTTVTQDGVLAVAGNGALGTGPVVVNATPQNGGLALDSGVTLTNPLTLTSGNILGDGTFNPSGAGLAGTVTIGSNLGVAGGLPFGNNNTNISGTLSFAGNLQFTNGGTYFWTIQDNARIDGVSSLAVAGNLDLTSLSAGGFNIYVFSFDANGNAGGFAANLNPASSHFWTIVSTGGSILGFNPANFSILSPQFEGMNAFGASNFFLTENGAHNQLILNFTPVPEPSTWALLGIGLTGVSFVGARRRRRAAAA
jgi:autotransporter-associated beta strand protein